MGILFWHRLNNAILQLVLNDVIVLLQNSGVLSKSLHQSPESLEAQLIVVWEWLVKLLPGQRYLVSSIFVGNRVNEFVVYRLLWSTNAKRFQFPERSHYLVAPSQAVVYQL